MNTYLYQISRVVFDLLTHCIACGGEDGRRDTAFGGNGPVTQVA